MTAADAPTLAQLAADVEAGWVWAISLSEAVNSGVGEGYNADREITDAQAAWKAYRQRVGDLEAFVEKLAEYNYEHSPWEYDEGMNTAREEIADEARALLSAAESEGGDGEQ